MDVRVIAMSMACFGLLACGRDKPVRDFEATSVLGVRPGEIAKAQNLPLGAACPIEQVNGEHIRAVPGLKAGTFVTFSGWSTIASERNPTPPLVHVVLRPVGSGGEADAFIPGKRVPRNDPSATDSRVRNAGFTASGRLPGVPGKYQVLVWVGNAEFQVSCDTGQVAVLE